MIFARLLSTLIVFHQQSGHCGNQASSQQINGDAMPVPGKVSDECSGNERCKSTANHTGNLISDSSATIAITGTKHFGKHRLLHAHHHVMSNVCQHDGEENYPENRLCFKRHKERKCAQRSDQRACDINPGRPKRSASQAKQGIVRQLNPPTSKPILRKSSRGNPIFWVE